MNQMRWISRSCCRCVVISISCLFPPPQGLLLVVSLAISSWHIPSYIPVCGYLGMGGRLPCGRGMDATRDHIPIFAPVGPIATVISSMWKDMKPFFIVRTKTMLRQKKIWELGLEGPKKGGMALNTSKTSQSGQKLSKMGEDSGSTNLY